ncbi:MAG: sortase [Gaiellaceae bacterium]
MIRRIGTLVILVGLGLLAWTGTVYLWKDPFTTAYTAYEQRQLESSLDDGFEAWRPVARQPKTNRPGRPARPADLRKEARAYRDSSDVGDAIARLEIPRLDLDVVVVNGADSGTLRRGPGRHLDTAMPGERRLVYVAGHRTTFGAPFSHIDSLRPGDSILLELPYASFEYRVTGHRIVDQYELSVLRSRGREELVLQACHPRFFASQRYLVYARPVHVVGKQAVSATG